MINVSVGQIYLHTWCVELAVESSCAFKRLVSTTLHDEPRSWFDLVSAMEYGVEWGPPRKLGTCTGIVLLVISRHEEWSITMCKHGQEIQSHAWKILQRLLYP